MTYFVTGLFFATAVFVLVFLASCAGWVPADGWLRRQQVFYERALYQLYLPNLSPRTVTVAAAACIPGLIILVLMAVNPSAAAAGNAAGAGGAEWFFDHIALPVLLAALGGAAGLFGPPMVTRFLIRRRVRKLEDQIVSGIQTLASGVRAGLNLVQAFQLLARNSPAPLSQEIGQMLREYEHGLTLEQAMVKTGLRIGSPTYRLLFSALETHRIRGGDLGETLDRIADAIREIHRLEKHVETLTAQGRAAARLMGIMPFVILLILWNIDPTGVSDLFVTMHGRFILLGVAVLIGLGFWWIRRIVDIDI